VKEWKCVELKNPDIVGKTIEEWEKAKWRLHTYTTASRGMGAFHYLLFEKGE